VLVNNADEMLNGEVIRLDGGDPDGAEVVCDGASPGVSSTCIVLLPLRR
jgi:hypothetical protein